jgi:acyl-CoA synthetase (AMP-forming)/AMP-acid ligase II
VVVRRSVALTPEAMTGFAREHLAGYKLPRSISFADEIPRNASGKILKKVLREPFWAGQQRRVG